MANKDDKLVSPPKKQSIEEVVEEAEVLKAQAEIEDDEAKKKAEAEAAIPEVEVDLDAERAKTKQEVTESVTKDIIEPLKKEILDLKTALTPEEKDEYDKFVDDYTAKNGEAPQWKQVAEFLKNEAVKEVEAKQQATREAEQKTQEEQKTQQEATAAENFKIWQGQLQEMESKDMLPKMEKAEAGDAGFDARVQLYGLMQATWQSEAPLSNLYEVYAKHWTGGKTKQPAGADAPVGMGTGGDGGEEDKDYKYGEVHQGGRDLESFILKELHRAQGK